LRGEGRVSRVELPRTRLQTVSLRLVGAFPFFEVACASCQFCVALVNRALACGEVGVSALDVGLAACDELFRIRAIRFGRRRSLATEPQVTPTGAFARLVRDQVRFSPLDLELAGRDAGCAIAKLALEVVELGKLLVAQARMLLRQLPREPEDLLAVRLLRGDPVVAIPAVVDPVVVLPHLQGI